MVGAEVQECASATGAMLLPAGKKLRSDGENGPDFVDAATSQLLSGDLDERMEAVIETHHGRLNVTLGSGENQAGFGKGSCHWLLKIECFVCIEDRNGVECVLSAGRSH